MYGFTGANTEFGGANACYRPLRPHSDFWGRILHMKDPLRFPASPRHHSRWQRGRWCRYWLWIVYMYEDIHIHVYIIQVYMYMCIYTWWKLFKGSGYFKSASKAQKRSIWGFRLSAWGGLETLNFLSRHISTKQPPVHYVMHLMHCIIQWYSLHHIGRHLKTQIFLQDCNATQCTI